MKMIPIKRYQEGNLLAKLKRPRNHGGEAALAASHAAGVAKMLLMMMLLLELVLSLASLLDLLLFLLLLRFFFGFLHSLLLPHIKNKANFL